MDELQLTYPLISTKINQHYITDKRSAFKDFILENFLKQSVPKVKATICIHKNISPNTKN